ncbi:MAG: hypothetical protein HW416_3242 [Chloroflexi bacterium]|nr:hypothetical protein [Chloroflexota bacterium]
MLLVELHEEIPQIAWGGQGARVVLIAVAVAICLLLCCFRPQRSLEVGRWGNRYATAALRQETATIL